MTTVVAGVIAKQDRVLICQRRRGDSFPLKWEFPGGKVRPGEALIEALARELREELGVEAAIGKEIFRTRHRYSGQQGPLELVFFSVRVVGQTVQGLKFEEIRWEEPRALAGYDFLAADRELIAKIASGDLRLTDEARA